MRHTRNTAPTFGTSEPLSQVDWAPWASYAAWDAFDWVDERGDPFDSRRPTPGEQRILRGYHEGPGEDGFLDGESPQWVFWRPPHCDPAIGNRWQEEDVERACFASVILDEIGTPALKGRPSRLRVKVGNVVGLSTMITLPRVSSAKYNFEVRFWHDQEPDEFWETRTGRWRIAEYEVGQDGMGELVICYHRNDGDSLIAHAVRSPDYVCAGGNLDLGPNGYDVVRRRLLGDRTA